VGDGPQGPPRLFPRYWSRIVLSEKPHPGNPAFPSGSWLGQAVPEPNRTLAESAQAAAGTAFAPCTGAGVRSFLAITSALRRRRFGTRSSSNLVLIPVARPACRVPPSLPLFLMIGIILLARTSCLELPARHHVPVTVEDPALTL
jgi:hypothetical protein